MENFADFIYWFHWAFIATIFFGPLLHFYKWPRYIFWVLFAAGIFGNLWWEGCPLTIWEVNLRESYGEYLFYSSGSFICDHLKDVFGIVIMPKTVDSAYCAMGFITAVTPQIPRLWKVQWSKLIHDTRKKLGTFPK